MKQTLRVFFIVFFIVGNVQAYDSIDLQGTWRAYGLASGPGEPWWERGVVTINSDGSFTGSTLESDGNSSTFSGTEIFNLSSDGIVTMSESENLQGSLNADKSIIVWTDTWSSWSAGTTELKILTKMGTSYSSDDLQGTWRVYGLASGPGAPWWERGVVTIKSDGSFTANNQESDGNSYSLSETFNLSSDGIITMPEFPNIQGSMNADKSIIVWTDTWSNWKAGTTELKIFTKMATSYSSDDLQGTWRAYGLASGPGAPWWERAVLTINSDGTFTANSQESDGNPSTFSGTFNLSSDGIITMPEFPNIQGSMNADKSIIVWTDTWSSWQAGTTELKIFTKMATYSDSIATTQHLVTEIYVATFGRAPAIAGLDYWADSVDTGVFTIDQVAQSFFDQPETQEKYPEGSSNSEFISTIFYNVLNRAPAEAGLTYWVDALDSGTVRRDQAIMAIINGAKSATGGSDDAATLAKKTEIGVLFAHSDVGSMTDDENFMDWATNIISFSASDDFGIEEAEEYIADLY